MHPILFELGGFQVPTYALAVVVAFVVARAIRQGELRRLRYERDPLHGWVSAGGLVGAVVGAKVGMLMFEPAADWAETLWRMVDLDFTGKTVLGGIAGGYIGVEAVKRLVGIRYSTGDAFAVCLPVGQAIGRLGCLAQGCCYGIPWGDGRHPTVLYEAALDLVLAGWLWSIRERQRPAGNLFRRYLIGYGLIRFAVDPLRGDPVMQLGPLSAVQWFCLSAVVLFVFLVVRSETSPLSRPS